MIIRNIYLEKLERLKNKQLIKVITGIRRCGKSTLMKMFQEKLLSEGINKNQIISLNFDDPNNEKLLDYKELYNFINKKLLTKNKYYIFLDEIQNVESFEKAVNGLFIKDNTDIYITGSNAYFLSGELATFLSGRYATIEMLPLSFKEYLSAFNDKTDVLVKYNNYLINGSFPYILKLDNYDDIRTYLSGIYNTVIIKDVATRKNITNINVLQDVIKFLFDNIGNLTSIRKIADTMTSKGRKISNHTLDNYISALTDSYILYKVQRYDIKGKQYLDTINKYYIPDIGLRYYLLGNKPDDKGHILENIVYLELLRRGYKVYVGKIESFEIDFITEKNGYTEYYQVAQTVMDENILQRELKPLNSVKDHNPKYLLTMDIVPEVSHNGIRQMNIIDWLLQD